MAPWNKPGAGSPMFMPTWEQFMNQQMASRAGGVPHTEDRQSSSTPANNREILTGV